MRKDLRTVIGILLMLIAPVGGIYLRFANIDMTETRLFISYWKEFLAIFILALSGFFIIEKQ